jgi:hypothetical protein
MQHFILVHTNVLAVIFEIHFVSKDINYLHSSLCEIYERKIKVTGI